jgi:hypothetical protein
VYVILQSLPAERQAQVVKVLGEARAQIEGIRSKAYGQISEVIASKAGGGST